MEQEQTQNQTVDTADPAELSFEALEAALQSDLTGESTAGAEPQSSQQLDGSPASQSEPVADQNQPDVSDPEGTPETVSTAELAEKLGVDESDLFTGLRINIGDGKSVTLEEWKGSVKAQSEAEALLAEATDRKQTIERELFQQQRALQAEMDKLGIKPDDSVIAEQSKLWEQNLEHQRRVAAELMPQLAEPEALQAAEKRWSEVLEGWGFNAAEQEYIVDARWKWAAQQFAELQDRIRAVPSQKVPDKAKQAPKRHVRGGNKVTRLKQALSEGKTSQDAAVSELSQLLG